MNMPTHDDLFGVANAMNFSFDIDDQHMKHFINALHGAADLPFAEANCSEEEAALTNDWSQLTPGIDLFDSAKFSVPMIKSVIFSGPATTILWADDTKTTVKVAEGQEFDRYAGFCAAVVKKLYGSSTKAKQIMDENDTELIRAAREAEKEALKQQRCEADIRARVRKAMKSVPSFEDFQRRAYDRAVAMVVDDIAADMAKDIRKRVQTRQATHDIIDALSNTGEEE